MMSCDTGFAATIGLTVAHIASLDAAYVERYEQGYEKSRGGEKDI